MYEGYITDIPGLKVGHAQDFEAMTGCTVIICEQGATTGGCKGVCTWYEGDRFT